METGSGPTAPAPSEDATEHVTAWALDADDAGGDASRRTWLLHAVALAVGVVFAGAALYGLLSGWQPTRNTPARAAITPRPAATGPPATTPTPEVPYWPDGVYLHIFDQNCGDACGPQTRAALEGCPEKACAAKRADIITLGHEACTAVKEEPLPQIMRELTGPPKGAFTPKAARAIINSAIEVYCPGAATPLP